MSHQHSSHYYDGLSRGNPPYPTQPHGKVRPPAYETQPAHAVPPVMTSPVPTTTTYAVVTPPAAVPLGPQPATLTCPSCGARITTRTEYETVTKTHVMCMLMCAVGLWLCCFIPYCVDSCKNLNHYCPNCDAYLGEYKS